MGKNNLHVLDLKVEINSRICAELEVKRSVARRYYVEYGPYPEIFSTKYEAALANVHIHVLSIKAPSKRFKTILNTQNIKHLSLEEGIPSAVELNYATDPLPLVIADFRAHLLKLALSSPQKIQTLLQKFLSRKFTPEEHLFLHHYPYLTKFHFLGENFKNISEIRKLEEVRSVTDSELKQILKENLYLLSPQERIAGLKPEERLAGLKPEERLAGLKPEELKRLIEVAKKRLEKTETN